MQEIGRENKISDFISNHDFGWKWQIDQSAGEFAVESQKNGRLIRKLRATVWRPNTIIKARMWHAVKRQSKIKASKKTSVPKQLNQHGHQETQALKNLKF